MRKLLLIGLVLAASGAMAQTAQHHPYHPAGGNDATIDQKGMFQIGAIQQLGEGNKATINQLHWGFANTAVIDQIGKDNEGTVNQTGAFNYAFLMQLGHKAEGTITQGGIGNVAAVLQLSHSYVNIEQYGNFNAIVGVQHNRDVNFCYPTQPGPYWYTCNVNMDYPTWLHGNQRGYGFLVVGWGGRFDTDDLVQEGAGNYFVGVGELKGDRKIEQTGYQWNDNDAARRHHMHLNNNYIFLHQEGGYAELTQHGKGNKIWLALETGYHHRGNPEAYITQNGKDNKVARFRTTCPTCRNGNVEGPAVFMGDKLIVNQTGYGNVASIEGLSANSTITITQVGILNSAHVGQYDFHHSYQAPQAGPCAGCR